MANCKYGCALFLSRPRRFGKSLLLSTFESYFRGKKELFQGLAVEKLETEWKEYPILHIDLNARKYEKPEDLIAMLNQHLEQWEAIYGDEKRERAPEERFEYVIRRASEQVGRNVVVLVDEYDKPLLQAIENLGLLEEYRKILKAFYGVLKSADRYLRFAFLTGVTKFSQVSVFSDLNQLQDISMWPDFTTICGITKEELVDNFRTEIDALAVANHMTAEETIEEMTRRYDGYHFDAGAPGMFNPFSVLSALKSKKFDSFWFQTGTPTFLVHMLQKTNFDLRALMDGIEAPVSSFAEYRVDANNPIPLIYQSGYLTIKDYDPEFQIYMLDFPNDEVKFGFLHFIAPFYTPVVETDTTFYIGRFIQELRRGEVDAFLERLRAFFGGISYELNFEVERHYQVVCYLVFKLMGQFTEAEVRSARGRADAIVKTPKYIYIFEFKLDGTAEEALKQIDDKGYLIPYTADSRQIVKVGVNFSKETRNIDRWLTE